MTCPSCRVPHEVPSVARLIAEDLSAQEMVAHQVIPSLRLNQIAREWFVLALRGFGYCQKCIFGKGSVIAAEVAAVSQPSSSKSPEEIEREYLAAGESNVLCIDRSKSRGFVSGRVGPGELVSNAECFRRATDGQLGPNDDCMPVETDQPKRGA